jgi:hypothetical protein
MTKALRPAGFYGRVSEDDEESIESQLAICREIAAADGHYIPDAPGFQFADVHVRGITKTRPGMDALERVICAREGAPFDRVYVRDAKRLGRWKDPRLHDYYAVKWERCNVSLRYADKKRHVEYSEGVADGDIGEYVIDKVDHVQTARDRTDIERRLRRARRRRLLNGFLPGGRAPYGLVRVLVHKDTREVIKTLEPGEYVKQPDARVSFRAGPEEELEVVRFLFDGIEAGKSFEALARELDARKVPPPGRAWWRNAAGAILTGEAMKWYPSRVGAMVKNEIYAGVLIFGDRSAGEPVSREEAGIDDPKAVRVENFYPDPPITTEQFRRVQNILSGRNTLWNKRRATKPKYLLSGKIRCSLCKVTIGGKTNNGGRYRTYNHWRHLKAGQERLCPNSSKSVPLSLVERAVIAQLRAVLSNPRLAELVKAELRQLVGADESVDQARARSRLQRKLRSARESLDRACQALLTTRSRAARETLEQNQDRLGLEVDRLEEELAGLDANEGRLRDALEREVWLAAEATALLRLLEQDAFELHRSLVERIVAYVEYDFQSGRLEIAIRAA